MSSVSCVIPWLKCQQLADQDHLTPPWWADAAIPSPSSGCCKYGLVESPTQQSMELRSRLMSGHRVRKIKCWCRVICFSRSMVSQAWCARGPSCWKMMSSEYWTQISQSIEREVEVSVRDIERFLGKLSVKEFFQNSHKLWEKIKESFLIGTW